MLYSENIGYLNTDIKLLSNSTSVTNFFYSAFLTPF